MKKVVLTLCWLVAHLVFVSDAAAAIGFVQVNFTAPQTPQSSVPVTYASAQTAGSLNVVVVGWKDSTSAVTSVTDSKGNTYTRAVGPTPYAGFVTQSIYYAKNIVAAGANSNTVTVAFNAPAAFPDIRILEYSGLDTVSPVDVTAAAIGNGPTSNSGAVTTFNANDLIFGANTVRTSTKGGATGFASRMITKPDGDLAEDRVVSTVGSNNASAALTSAGPWVMQMVAFKAAGSTGPTGPTVTINQASGQADPTSAVPINFTAVFSAPVTGFTASGVTIGGTAGGPRSAVITGSGTTYNVAISGMTTSGTITVTIPANAATDGSGRGNSASSSTDNTVTYSSIASQGLLAAYPFSDGAGPTATDASGNGVTGTIQGATWTPTGRYGSALAFNGSSSYVDLGSPAALNLTGSMTLSAWVFATANPADDGQIISKSSGAGWQLKTTPDTGQHTFGIAISSSSSVVVQRYSNTVRALNTWYHVAGVYNAASRTLDIYVNGVLDNGTLLGTVPASQFNAAQNVNIGRRADGFYFQGTIDEVRVYNTALTQAQIQTDMSTPIGGSTGPMGPTVTINQASGQADPTGASPINFTAVFSAPVTGFAGSGVTIGGTAGGPRSAAVTGSGSTYNVAISGMTTSGTVTVSIPANAAQDTGGNGNSASTSTDNSVTYTTGPTNPTVTINQASGQADPTNSPSINFTAIFSAPVTGFTGSDVVIGGTAGGTRSAAVTGSGTTYNVAVSGMTTSGTVTVSISANAAQDASGNGNTSSTSTDNTVTSDTTPPDVDITFPADGAQVSDIVTVTADATDDVGVVGVQFLVDGVNAGSEDTTSPYGYVWDTRGVSNGSHSLTARGRDAAGNVVVSPPIVVNVANSNYTQNEILASGFSLPTCFVFLPDNRMLVAELQGRIKVLPPPYTQPDPTLFLQLPNVGSAGVQQGIYTICLDPGFATNHYYYLFYTAGSPNRDRLSRFTANAALTGTVADSELILYQDPQDANAEHHGGSINFGNDGKIYFTTGEHFDPPASQDLSNPRGKIHRINPDGTVPTDNPFYDGAGPNWDSVWALGLRNPFRAYYDMPTGRLLIGDVGGNDYNTAKEELDIGSRGANYGWPNTEGPCFGYCTDPAYYYPHNGRDACIVGGFVYHGAQFPSSYQGSYFYADYTQNWIRRLTFDANGAVSGAFNFEPPDGSLDGPYGDIVYLAEGPEGAIYYIDLGYSDITGTFGVSKIRRISYVQSNLPPVVVASDQPVQGMLPMPVYFFSDGSYDPEGQPITFAWDFGDGATSTEADPVHIYVHAGQYTARLTVSDGVNSTVSPPLAISAGNRPSATITSPVDGSTFIAGDTIFFAGSGTDQEDGVIPPSGFTWNIDFLHEGHVHPGIPITGVTSGSFVIPTVGHDFSGNTRYRIQLTVTDSDGLQDVKSVLIWPRKVNLAFDTVPTGLTLTLDGIVYTTPFVHDTLTNFMHTVVAPDQTLGQNICTFASWSDGGAATHVITVPATSQAYTATYTVTQSPLPPGLAAGWSFNEGAGVTAGDASGNNNTLSLINGASWTAGHYNGGLSLTGTPSALAPNSPSLALSGSYTLTAWIKPASLSGYQTVLLKEDPSGGGCGYWLQTVGNLVSSGFNGGSGCIEHTANANLQVNTWYHIAAVFDNTAHTYTIYINGVLSASQSEAATPVPNTQGLTIGRSSSGEYWNGVLDEVRIYNRALSPAEVQVDMNTPLP